MKHYLFFSLRARLLLLALIVSATSLYAETVKLNGLYYSLGTTTAQVVNDQSSDKSVYKDYTAVTIPASVTYNNYTYPVTSIGTSAFEGLTNLQSVTLPTSVTTIGTDAFWGCTKLGSVNLEEGLTSIGLRAFYNCALTEITIPSTVTSIGNSAFKGNPTTTIVWKPADCSIGSDDSAPFYSTNSQVTSFTFADGVEVVPSYICKNMNKIDTIVLPASVNRLGQYAFMNCTNLKSINLPVMQKTLPISFLEGCTSLESIELPATLTTISADAFYGCIKLGSVNLEEGLTTIGLRAFYNCKLTEITIPSTVTSIGNAAFKENPTTTIVWKPKSCTIGSDDSAPFYSTNSQVTSFTFGDSVQVIPAYLCKYMKIETIAIPATVTNIGQSAFMYCTNLKHFEFPQGIKTVATSVLEGCTALEEVVIPSSVTTINQDAFYNCSALQAIRNYAYTPQTITERTVNNVNKQTCILYVPMDYIDLYQAKAVWCDFANIIGVATDLQFEEQTVQVSYLKEDSTLHYMEAQKWQIPHAPRIEGFTFLKWQVLPGDLAEGIVLQAVYEANTPTEAPAVYTNPANPAQKLIKNGNVYILSGDKTYTVTGQEVK
ncbi:MAG: leucine-rich repeat domain-containing protein [Paludibacteraceae bacterium]|nr:leucine-rich repeat domain-containing protein [Paludibacteraceae bacterium]